MSKIIKTYESYVSKDIVENVEDYFTEWLDKKKYNVKISKIPSKKAPLVMKNGRVNNNYNAGEVTKKGAYVIKFEVKNNIDDLIIFVNELNSVLKRWSLKKKIYSSSVKGNKIIISLEL